MKRWAWIAVGFALMIPTIVCAAEELEIKEGSAKHRALVQQAKQADAQVRRQLQLIEVKLKQAETKMAARLKQLSKMRESALKKNDAKSLKRIEQLEVQAVQQYDAEVSRIVGIPQQGKKTASGNAQRLKQRTKNGKQVYARPKPNTKAPVMKAPGARKSDRQNAKSEHKKPRRKRFKLWPF